MKTTQDIFKNVERCRVATRIVCLHNFQNVLHNFEIVNAQFANLWPNPIPNPDPNSDPNRNPNPKPSQIVQTHKLHTANNTIWIKAEFIKTKQWITFMDVLWSLVNNEMMVYYLRHLTHNQQFSYLDAMTGFKVYTLLIFTHPLHHQFKMASSTKKRRFKITLIPC